MTLDLKTIVSKTAPILGNAIASSSPIGAMAVSLIGAAFGVKSNNPIEIAQAVQNDPDHDTKLLQIEDNHLDALALANSTDYKTEVGDRENARDELVPQAKTFMQSLSIIVTLGFFMIFILLFCEFINVDATEKDLLSMLLGVLIGKWSTIIDFWFGSSRK